MRAPKYSRDLGLLAVALAAGALFFASLGRLWPLAPADLTASRDALATRAIGRLGERGLDVSDYTRASELSVDEAALNYAERAFGRERAEQWVRDGLPLVRYDVLFR